MPTRGFCGGVGGRGSVVGIYGASIAAGVGGDECSCSKWFEQGIGFYFEK